MAKNNRYASVIKGPLKTSRRYIFIVASVIGIALAFYTLYFRLLPIGSSADLDKRAKEIFAEENNISIESVEISNKSEANFKYIKKTVYEYKLFDNSHKKFGIIAIDRSGNRLDQSSLVNEELAEKKIRFGKIDPSFGELLINMPQSQNVETYIECLGSSYQYPVESNEYATRVANNIKKMGYSAEVNNYGNVEALLPPKVIFEIKDWQDIQKIRAVFKVKPPDCSNGKPC